VTYDDACAICLGRRHLGFCESAMPSDPLYDDRGPFGQWKLSEAVSGYTCTGCGDNRYGLHWTRDGEGTYDLSCWAAMS